MVGPGHPTGAAHCPAPFHRSSHLFLLLLLLVLPAAPRRPVRPHLPHVQRRRGLRAGVPHAPRPAPVQEVCPVTHKPALYRDPVTDIPYANTRAFKIIREAYKKYVAAHGLPNASGSFSGDGGSRAPARRSSSSRACRALSGAGRGGGHARTLAPRTTLRRDISNFSPDPTSVRFFSLL
ncbi:hypothetical protein ANANG_G00180950 [Anguilla anguilla]|uniref:Vps72/YL1 C-terminal domain-containing protein n=1 Tax=Anguilla anguilla TaxID=7936 RepID=A0A9D3RXB4_ANGAN|nr:hypothetical protein ANANG_G00180950 [Anguilla anguilla]